MNRFFWPIFSIPILRQRLLPRLLHRLSLRGGLLVGTLAITTIPALAQTANFEPLTLARGFSNAAGTVEGYTGGAFSLAAIANRDQAGTLCLGYADSTPDHILTLEADFPRLTIQVNSGGNDTTLVIQNAANGAVWCGDDTRGNKDASIEGNNWGAGTYRVWVGAFESGARYNYTLRVSE